MVRISTSYSIGASQSAHNTAGRITIIFRFSDFFSRSTHISHLIISSRFVTLFSVLRRIRVPQRSHIYMVSYCDMSLSLSPLAPNDPATNSFVPGIPFKTKPMDFHFLRNSLPSGGIPKSVFLSKITFTSLNGASLLGLLVGVFIRK